MRAGTVIRNSGFDGQFGRIRFFGRRPAADLLWQKRALAWLATKRIKKSAEKPAQNIQLKSPEDSNVQKAAGINWSAEQLRAMESFEAPVLWRPALARGKTRVLIGRISLACWTRALRRKNFGHYLYQKSCRGKCATGCRVGSAGKQELPVCDTLHALALALRAEAENSARLCAAALEESAKKSFFAGANSGLDRKSVARLWMKLLSPLKIAGR